MTLKHLIVILYEFPKTALAARKFPCYSRYSFPIAHGGEPTALAGNTLSQALVPTFVGVIPSSPSLQSCRWFQEISGFSSFNLNKDDFNSS